MSPETADRERLESIFRAALAAVEPAAAVRTAVRIASSSGALEIAGRTIASDARIFSLAVGKAAGPMAQALEEIAGERIAEALAIVKDGHAAPLSRFRLREVAHPVPDERCESAAREAFELVARAGPTDVFVLLLSGGASSLLSCPAAGLTLDDFAAATRALLEAGADIEALNTVRKHLSAVSGGRLARIAMCSRVEVLAISDVPGDGFDVIGSGPMTADGTSFDDARSVLHDFKLANKVPERVIAHLEAGGRGEKDETPKPGDPIFERVHETLLATNRTARDAALSAARELGFRGVALGEVLQGEARNVGARLANLALAVRAREPVCLIAGGETTVTVRGKGRGGRSQELALGAAQVLDGSRAVSMLAAGTDGTDGPTDAAGAYADGSTLSRARARGLDPRAALDDNDAYVFFREEGGLFSTGPTRTNVMDLALAMVGS